MTKSQPTYKAKMKAKLADLRHAQMLYRLDLMSLRSSGALAGRIAGEMRQLQLQHRLENPVRWI